MDRAKDDDPGAPSTVTRELRAAGAGDSAALGRVFELVLEELRDVARRQLRRSSGATLATDDVVNEVFIKLASADGPTWEDRVHFFGIAARAMRQLLVDYARRRAAAKRGGGLRAVTLDTGHAGTVVEFDELLALNEALDRLDALNPRLREVVELRFFGGMTEEEIAHLLGLSTRTVERDWQKARMFLYDQLGPPAEA